MSTNTQAVNFTTEEINLLFDALDKHVIPIDTKDIMGEPNFGKRSSFFAEMLRDMSQTSERIDNMHRENKEKIRTLQTKLIQYKSDLTSKSVEDIEATPADEASNA